MPKPASNVLPIHLRSQSRLAPPPKHLAAEEKALFQQLISELSIDTSDAISLLSVAMDAHMRMRRARELIDRQGELVDGRYGPRANPAIAIERDSREAFLRAMRALSSSGR